MSANLAKFTYLCNPLRRMQMNIKSYIPFYKRNLSLAIPVMITQAGQMIVQFADNIMVGQLGTSQFAGVGFANALFSMGLVFCTCFTQGLIPFIGQSYGRGEHGKVSEYFTNGILLNALMCISVMAIMMAAVPLMDHMGQDPRILGYAREYYRIMVWSLAPFIIFYVLRALTEGVGNTKYTMYITVFCNILNIFLNWVLIFGHLGMEAMGVAGAAWATFISRCAMLGIGIAILLSGKLYKRYLGDIRFRALNFSQFKDVMKTSFPMSFQGLVEVTTFSIAGIMAGWFGEVAMAAHQASQTIITFSFMVAQGVGVAATIRVSHQYGERRFADARKAGFAASHISIALMALAGITFILFNDVIPYIFTQDHHVAEIASKLLYVAAAFQLFDAVQLSALASLRALADVKWPLVTSLFTYYIIGLPFAYFAGTTFGLGPVGVWLGLLAGLMLAAILFLYRFNKITKGFTTNN
ncbi:MAG: MATE family efflux transporter [Bacteroidales bacterium]|nr:MATE family efflux transporter [Bacteroidales bacterium]